MPGVDGRVKSHSAFLEMWSFPVQSRREDCLWQLETKENVSLTNVWGTLVLHWYPCVQNPEYPGPRISCIQNVECHAPRMQNVLYPECRISCVQDPDYPVSRTSCTSGLWETPVCRELLLCELRGCRTGLYFRHTNLPAVCSCSAQRQPLCTASEAASQWGWWITTTKYHKQARGANAKQQFGKSLPELAETWCSKCWQQPW